RVLFRSLRGPQRAAARGDPAAQGAGGGGHPGLRRGDHPRAGHLRAQERRNRRDLPARHLDESDRRVPARAFRRRRGFLNSRRDATLKAQGGAMKRRILLADDSVTIQKVIELTFMDEDYEVRAVSNGDDAVKLLPEMKPDF